MSGGTFSIKQASTSTRTIILMELLQHLISLLFRLKIERVDHKLWQSNFILNSSGQKRCHRIK
jgi:hypothetical protein